MNGDELTKEQYRNIEMVKQSLLPIHRGERRIEHTADPVLDGLKYLMDRVSDLEESHKITATRVYRLEEILDAVDDENADRAFEREFREDD